MKIKYIYYRLRWHLAKFIPSFIHLDIELTNYCNQSCMSCWHNGKLSFQLGFMKKEKVFSLLEKARSLGALSVKLNLRGEPLLYKDLIQVIQKAKSLKYIDIMINTNGVLLDSQKMLELNYAGLTTMIVSVDSFDKDTYCKIHNCKEKDYKLLMRNLSWMHNFYKSLKFKVILNFHINQYNYNERFPRFHKFKKNIRMTMTRKGEDISLKGKTKKRKKKCPHLMRRLTVTQNGFVYPCCVCYDEPDDLKVGVMNSLETSLMLKNMIIEKYKEGQFLKSCIDCSSGDIYE